MPDGSSSPTRSGISDFSAIPDLSVVMPDLIGHPSHNDVILNARLTVILNEVKDLKTTKQ